MNKLILVLFISFGVINFNYAQSYLWAKSAGGNSNDEGLAIATDANGNVFVVGYFTSPTIIFGTTTLTNAGGSDIFIVKYDPSGNVIWAKSAGGIDIDGGNSISIDANGNVFVAGHFSSPTIVFGTTTLTNVGDYDIFIVKYDISGNVLWAKSAGGIYSEYGSISIDVSGNVFLTGFSNSHTIAFGSITLTNPYPGTGSRDIFIGKYDPSGNILWVKSVGGNDDDRGGGSSTDVSGNLFVTGYFASSTITFGNITLTNSYAGRNDVFIVKYDGSGNVLWAKSATGGGDEVGASTSTDISGNVFVTGDFQGSSITFGATTLTNTNTGIEDIFIAKYDASGNFLWAKSAGGTSGDYASGIATDASGNVFVTGEFGSFSIKFDTIKLTNSGSPYYDIFILKYDASGNALWAESAGGSNYDNGRGICTDGSGNVFVTGSFESSSTTFNNTILTNAVLGGGSYDILIVKLEGPSSTNVTIGNSNSISINIYPNPFSSSATLKIEMLNPSKATVALADVTGKIVHYFSQGITLNAGEHTFLYPENLLSGVYVVKIFTADAVESLKCVKVE